MTVKSIQIYGKGSKKFINRFLFLFSNKMLVIRACIHNMLVLFCGFKNGCFSYKQKYVHKLLVNCLVKLAQEKKCGYKN